MDITKQHIHLKIFEELLPQLEPYYIPCKARLYIYNNPFTPAHAITILRQVLKVHSHTLKASEKTRGGEKTIWYQILCLENDTIPTLEGDITVSFT